MRYWHDVEGADNGRGRSDSGLRGNVVVLVVMVNRSRRSDRQLHHSRHVGIELWDIPIKKVQTVQYNIVFEMSPQPWRKNDGKKNPGFRGGAKTTGPADSRIIADYSTKGALPSLTLEIERDPVYSGRYGRS
jgi:hypothetical protein